MTPYQDGFNTTLQWLRNGRTGERMPPRNENEAFYLAWWAGAADAHHYQDGYDAVMTKVEDWVLQGVCVLMVLVGACMSVYALFSVSPIVGLIGCLFAGAGMYASSCLTASIKKRELKEPQHA